MSQNVPKMGYNPGVEKMVKMGQKWSKMRCKIQKLILYLRMIITLFFSKLFPANETIADKISTGQEK